MADLPQNLANAPTYSPNPSGTGQLTAFSSGNSGSVNTNYFLQPGETMAQYQARLNQTGTSGYVPTQQAFDTQVSAIQNGTPISVGNLSPSISTGTMAETPKTSLDINSLLNLNQQLYQQMKPDTSGLDAIATKYAQLMQPSAQETALQGQYATAKGNLRNFDLSLAQGQQAQYGLGRPLDISTGRANQLAQNSALQRQSMVNELADVTDALGIAKEERQLSAQVAQGLMSVEQAKIQLTQSAQENANQMAQNFINTAMALDKQSRDQLAFVLDKFNGVDPSKMSVQEKSQIEQYAMKVGISPSLLIQGMTANYAKYKADLASSSLDDQYKRAQINNLNSQTSAPKLTDSQVQSNTYAVRVQQANQTIEQTQGDIQNMNYVWFQLQEKLPPQLQSNAYQQYTQASRNLINAILRRESGAAISESEFQNARAQYLPQPGDTKETLALKAQNRQTILSGLIQGAGKAHTSQTNDPLGIR